MFCERDGIMASNQRSPLGVIKHWFSQSGDQAVLNAMLDCPHATWMFDCETLHFLAVNEPALDLYGYTRREFLLLTPLDIRPLSEIRTFLRTAVQHPCSKIEPLHQQHATKDGRPLPVEIRSRQTIFQGREVEVVCAIPEGQRLAPEVGRLFAVCERSRKLSEA